MASENNQILKRAEADSAYTWAIEDIFPSDEAWEAAVEKLQQKAGEIAGYQGTLGDSAKQLYGYCLLETQINDLLENIYGYANRQYDVDTTNSTYQAMMAKATSIYVECSGKLAFSSPEILAIPDETLEQFFVDEPGLSIYRRSIMEIRRMKEHILSPLRKSFSRLPVNWQAAPKLFFL